MEEKEFKNNPEFKDSNLTKREFVPEIIKSCEEQIKYIESKRQGYTIEDFPEFPE